MPVKKPDPAIAHVHAPRFPQDPVEFLGNRRGLERLINALIDAVDLGRAAGEVCTSEGETFAVRVTRLDGDRRAEEWLRSGSPYWDIDDPMIARVLELMEENARLRQVVASLRRDASRSGGSTAREGTGRWPDAKAPGDRCRLPPLRLDSPPPGSGRRRARPWMGIFGARREAQDRGEIAGAGESDDSASGWAAPDAATAA